MDKVRNVLILGYYHRQNLGDEMFSFIFSNYFQTTWPKINLTISNTDDITSISDDIDLIICGGGDIINDYFLHKINLLIKDKRAKIPIYAWSVGFPYPKLIQEGALDIFDYIIHRNKDDEARLLTKYGQNRVKYFPDLGFLLPKYSQDQIKTADLDIIRTDKGKKIGVFLSKTIYHRNDPEAYNRIVDNIAYLLTKIAKIRKQRKIFGVNLSCQSKKPEYQIYLCACCTHDKSDKENDRLINQDIMTKIQKYGRFDNIKCVDARIQIDEIIPLFKNFYMTICLRFHAHVFSILSEVPMLSIYSSRKVENLLNTCDLTMYSEKMEIDPEFMYPIKVDCWKLFKLFNRINQEYDSYQQKLHNIRLHNSQQMEQCLTFFKNLILHPLKYYGHGTPALEYKVQMMTLHIAQKICEFYSTEDMDDTTKKSYVFQLADANSKSKRSIISFLNEVNPQITDKCEISRFLTEYISFTLTGLRHSEFNFGLQQQILLEDYHLYESVKYIISEYFAHFSNQHILNNRVKRKYRRFDFHFFQQNDLTGFHRSGWSYVVQSMQDFHRRNAPIFDTFLDKTFGWNYDFYTRIGILPFKKKWAGIFHHTPNDSYSINNLNNVFDKPNFIASLDQCVGIIVLSENLKNWISMKLLELEVFHIPVEVLHHPTEFVDNCFTMSKFIHNPQKKIVQVGAWLRNSYAIYQLNTPKHGLQKCALRGRNMWNYFPTDNYLEQIKEALYKIGNNGKHNHHQQSHLCRPCHQTICRPNEASCNKYIIGLYQMIEDKYHSVKVIDRLSNEEYDELLSQNIVFLNLVDASAVNTVIECIVRHTPIIINRLPAVEEYLGTDYPLYYETFEEAIDLINNFYKILEGHHYLVRLDKTPFKIETYISDFIQTKTFNYDDSA